jgi:ElaB/YqjD/DUF883 family membrane-anchored ribosome-binding protein
MNKRVHHSADEIEREIRATETDIARTLDLLQDKLSPGAVIDTLLKSSRENGAEFAANFGRSVRDNPLPITLIGTGLAWLLLSRRGNGHHRQEAVEYAASPEPHEEWHRDEDANRIYHAGVYPTGTDESEGYAMSKDYTTGSPGEKATEITTEPTEHDALGAKGSAESEVLEGARSPESGAAAAARRAEDRARAAAHAAQERARGLGDRARASARDARSTAGEAYSGARSAADEAYSGVKSSAHRAYSGARGGAERAAERLQAGGEAAYRRSSEMAYRTTSRATEAVSALGSSLREHPIVAGAVLAGIGALVGMLLPPTRREDALLGEKSDSAKAMAAEAAEREARRAREVAGAAAEGARREAEARGLTPGSLADRAEEEIRRMADAGKEVARAAMREGEAAAKKDSGGDKDSSGDEEKRDDRNRSGEEPNARDPYLDAQAAPPPRPAITPVATGPQPVAPTETTDPLKKED